MVCNKGPFFNERDINYSFLNYLKDLRRLIINLLLYFFALRVRCPKAGHHKLTGRTRPIEIVLHHRVVITRVHSNTSNFRTST
jgi:hypothetical protein